MDDALGEAVIGEFAPPREVVTVGIARLAGPGTVRVGAGGLAFEGPVLGVESRVPVYGSVAVLAAAAVGSVLVPGGEQVLLPLAVLGVAGMMALRMRSEVGVGGRHVVPWARVEHVVRLPSAPDTVAFVLDGPVGGRGTPEQVYFAPTAGVEALVEALRARGPVGLSMDVG
ncbi:MAG: hypothetical protein R3F59_06250 [Myxococcota bacterium]